MSAALSKPKLRSPRKGFGYTRWNKASSVTRERNLFWFETFPASEFHYHRDLIRSVARCAWESNRSVSATFRHDIRILYQKYVQSKKGIILHVLIAQKVSNPDSEPEEKSKSQLQFNLERARILNSTCCWSTKWVKLGMVYFRILNWAVTNHFFEQWQVWRNFINTTLPWGYLDLFYRSYAFKIENILKSFQIWSFYTRASRVMTSIHAFSTEEDAALPERIIYPVFKFNITWYRIWINEFKLAVRRVSKHE